MKGTYLVVSALALGVAGAAVRAAEPDFGLKVEGLLNRHAVGLFGVTKPLPESSRESISQSRALSDPLSLVTLAGGLTGQVVSAGVAAPNIDMYALWPDETQPEWLIACNEQGTGDPGLQRIEIATGAAETILTGTSSCDGVRRTNWGTVLFSEEAGGGPTGGRVYELQDPLNTTGVLLDRTTGIFSGGVGAENFAVRPALGRLSYEGFALYSSGLVYYGDENRPSQGVAGGAYFKFIPTNPAGQGGRGLEDSPLVSGSIYGLRLGLRSGATDYGQGTQTGFGTWVPICAEAACDDIDLRAQAAALFLTGYYRPEDIDIDGAAAGAGLVRFCGNNTGNEEDDQNWGETVCLSDGTEEDALANTATPEVQILQLGSPAYAMPDNIAYQPGRGNWIVHEDADTEYLTPHNNDLWACLPDGADADLKSDGCVRIATLNDLGAEWTGGAFNAAGDTLYVSVQHNVSGFGTVIAITGWQ
jgi:secreted PhoX family phosphatase